MRRSELARVRAMEAEVLELQERLGADDPVTVESRVRLVEAYERLPGFDDEQRSWEERSAAEMGRAELRERVARGWEELLADREGRLGPGDPDTLDAALGLARLSEGPRKDELEQRVVRGWERIAADRIRALGLTDPAAVEARERHIALAGRWIGDDEARRIRERSVAEHEDALGPEHPATLHARIDLLGGSGMPGREAPEVTAAAEELIDRAYGILGPAHKDVRRLRYLLVATHLMAGRPETAEAISRRYPSPGDDDFFLWSGPETGA